MNADDWTNVGKWDAWYEEAVAEAPYGDEATYRMAAAFFSDCASVEDWGCGLGWFRRYIPTSRYRGVDGSMSRFADEVVDLASYRSAAEGVLLRHVLEHDYRWQAILENAVASFSRKLVLVLYTPVGEHCTELAFYDDPGVPALSLPFTGLTSRLAGLDCQVHFVASATDYGGETVFYVRRPTLAAVTPRRRHRRI